MPTRPPNSDNAIQDKWQPIFEAAGIDTKRIPMDDFEPGDSRVEYTYLLDVDDTGWALFDGRRERRVLTLPVQP